MARRRYGRTKKRNYRRRSFKRKYYRKKYRTPSVNHFGPLGKTQLVKLRRVQQISIDAALGVVSDHVFSANGLYDTDITTAGQQQPYGFDQMMQFFNHYTVIGSKCTVKTVNNQPTPFWAGVQLRDNATSLGGVATRDLIEQPGITPRLIGYKEASGTQTMVRKFSARKFFSAKNIVNKSLYRGDTTTNPTEQAYFHVFCGPQNTADNLVSQTLWVTIEYTAVLSEPLQLVPS